MGLRVLRLITRFLLWVFFQKVDVRGRDLVPLEGPLLVVANHPNVLLDVLLLGAYLPRHNPRFIGKATLFQNPLLGWILRRFGVIPVARVQDAGSRLASNRQMFRRAAETLRSGESLIIFPEGLSHALHRVNELKPGAARIALAAVTEPGMPPNFRIQPVGLDYADPAVFRSRVSIHFGPAIDPSGFARLAQSDFPLAEENLTSTVYESLKVLTQHIEEKDLEEVVREVTAVYGKEVVRELSEEGERSPVLRARQEIVRAVTFFRVTDPALFASIAGRLRVYYLMLRRLGFEYGTVSAFGHPLSAAERALAFLLAPLALCGFLLNCVPYYVPRLFVPPYRREPEMIASVKFSIGSVTFIGYYAVIFMLLWASLPIGTALVLSSAVPVLGLFTLLYQERLLARLPLWYGIVVPRERRYILEKLAGERERLLADLDALKERYLDSIGSRRA